MEYFPLFLRLTDVPVLVVGGGEVAARKIVLLRAAGAAVTVVAPKRCAAIEAGAARGDLTVIDAVFTPALVQGRRLVIAATDRETVNEAVRVAAEAAGVLVNVVDDRARSSCIVPALIDRDPVLVAVSTGGSAPVLATELRSRIETLLPPQFGELARFAARHREAVRAALPTPAARRRFWRATLTGSTAARILAGETPALAPLLAAARDATAGRGTCDLVVVDDPDPDRLPLGAVRALFGADHVCFDADVPAALTALARRDAARLALPPADSAYALLRDRSARFAPLLEAGDALVYLSTRQGAWLDGLAASLHTQGIATTRWTCG